MARTLDPNHPHRLFGWPLPPLAGGAPLEGEVEGTAPQVSDAASSTDGSPKVELPFRLEEVEDVSHREWLTGRQAQMQAGFDKELNRLRSEGASLKPLQEMASRLQDPDTQQEALTEFLAQHGVELDYDDDDDAVVDPGDNEALRRLEDLENRAQSRDEQERETAFLAHVDVGLLALAVQEGHKTAEELPEIVRDQVLSAALSLPRLDNGLLDMSGAVTQYDAQRAYHSENARKGYLKSKDTPFVDLSGEAGDPQVDLTKKTDRLAAANAIAGRHL